MRVLKITVFLLLVSHLPALCAERPPARSRAEVDAVLGRAANAAKARATAQRPVRICLVASKQDHGPGEHDYPAWQTNWTKLLGKAPSVHVTTAWKWPETFTNIDVAVFYYWNHDWSPQQYQQLDGFLEQGGGVVLLHSSTIADKQPEKLAERIGLAFQPGRSKYRHGPLDLKIIAPPDEPITRGLPRQIHFVDESYWPMIGDTNSVRVLATANEEGKDWPMLWTRDRGRGRVFASIVGHYAWTYDDPLFRIIVLRGIAWVVKEPVERFEPLATEGLVLKE